MSSEKKVNDLTHELENLTIGTGRSNNGPNQNTGQARKSNPWNVRASASQTVPPVEESSAGANETDQWPGLSENLATHSQANSTVNKPKKPNKRNWDTVDIYPSGSASRRGNVHNTQGSVGQNSSGYRNRGRGSGRYELGQSSNRGQSRNQPSNSRRGRQPNGYANQSSEVPSGAQNTQPGHETTSQGPIAVSAAAAVNNARGAYRGGGRGRRGNTVRMTRPLLDNPSNNPPGMPAPFPPVVPLARQLPAGVSIQPPIIRNGPAPAVFPPPDYFNPAAVENVPTPQVPKSRPQYSLLEFADLMRNSSVRPIAPSAFEKIEAFKGLFDKDSSDPNASLNNALVLIGEQIYLCLHSPALSFLRFENRHDFINHQVHFYFSLKNLKTDAYLRGLIEKNDGICPFGDLLNFNRLKSVKATVNDLIMCGYLENNVTVVYNTNGEPYGYQILAIPPAVGDQQPLVNENLTTTSTAAVTTLTSSPANSANYPRLPIWGYAAPVIPVSFPSIFVAPNTTTLQNPVPSNSFFPNVGNFPVQRLPYGSFSTFINPGFVPNPASAMPPFLNPGVVQEQVATPEEAPAPSENIPQSPSPQNPNQETNH